MSLTLPNTASRILFGRIPMNWGGIVPSVMGRRQTELRTHLLEDGVERRLQTS